MKINANLANTIYRHSLNIPDAPAVVCRGQTLTYREFAGKAAQIAAVLCHSAAWQGPAGNPPRVGILASRGIDACVALMGACWAGATYVPIGLKLPEERILTLLSLCNLSAIIADEEGAKLLSEQVLAACPPIVIHTGKAPTTPVNAVVNLIALDDLPTTLATESPTPPALMAASDTAYIIFTSGTTGVPKGVMISAGAARHYVAMITEKLGLQTSDRALETCELSFDFSVHNMFSTWEAGASLHILPATMVMNAVKFAQNSGLTVWNSVPSLAGMLRQIKALKPDSLSSLRLTVFGGEQLPEGAVTSWQSAAPNSTIFNLYGPTEATVFCLAQATPLSITPGRAVVAIGEPLPGNEAAIFDAHGQTVADGTPGELAIAGVQLADGYLGTPELSAARFPVRDGKRWYLTGDLAIRTFSPFSRISFTDSEMGIPPAATSFVVFISSFHLLPLAAAGHLPCPQGFFGVVCLDDQSLKPGKRPDPQPHRLLGVATFRHDL